MSVETLLATLRKNQQQQIADIWREAETEAAVYDRQKDAALLEIQADYEKKLAAAKAREQEKLQRLARHRKRQRRLQAEQRLAARLRASAERMLSSLRNEEYPEVFRALVNELPERQWATVRVNPADEALARACLPAAAMETDAGIVGGLVVTALQGAIRVDNTFTTRLENIWPGLAPAMVGEIYAEARNDEDPQIKQTERISD